MAPGKLRGPSDAPSGDAVQSSGVTADLAAALGAGRITPRDAINCVIDRVVDSQVGAHASAAVREQVRAALESVVADDPLLSEKINALGR